VNSPDSTIDIGGRLIGSSLPTYFIADIAANHDGDLERAKQLIRLAARAGADAAKFQHFKAATIVSDFGFKTLGGRQSHQANWKTSVFEVYQNAAVPETWTAVLKRCCDEEGIAFFTSPYDLALVDHVDPYVPAFKVGSGDITWHDIIRHMASKGKPLLIASGASSMDEVAAAMEAALEATPKVALMQCNTNYTADLENFKFIQLNVLRSYRAMYPNVVLGLSDHTRGHSTVLGAVALGARIIEKHFTDNTTREGPDHHFAMDPQTWQAMVSATRELEAALGCGIKRVEENERDTVVLQRRSVRARRDLAPGMTVVWEDLIVLRPCPSDAISPVDMPQLIDKKVVRTVRSGDVVRWTDLE